MRRISTMCCVAIAAMLVLLAEGCSSSSSSAAPSGSTTQATADLNKDYAEPKLAPKDSAIVKAKGGVKVVSVDGAHVAGSGIQMANYGGNTVVLAPGTHRIVARRAVSCTPITYNDVSYEQTFEAGHTYRVGPDSEFGSGIKLEDVTAR